MHMNTRFKQRGAAALVVAMVLLFGMTLVAFFANRTMIFEQRTSANQYRYTKAFELADAGVEWAIARLNDELTLAANSCTPAVGSTLKSFRDRYIRPTAANPPTHTLGWLDPVSTVYPGCEIDPTNGTFNCGCPSAGAATLVNADRPRFRVQFNAVTAGVNNPTTDFVAVEIISRGCTSGDPCDPTAAATASDSSVVARVLVKVRPSFPTLPGAGLISGSTTVVGGSINVVNTDEASNGITINTGSTVNLTGSGTTVQTLPGKDPTASILDNDPSLLKLTNLDSTGEQFFTSYFGEGFAKFQSNLATKVITAGAAFNATTSPLTCNAPLDCGRAVSSWVDKGFEQFWVAPAVTFNNSNMPSTTPGGTLGTAEHALQLATPNTLSFSGGVTAYGIFYAATATAQDDAVLGAGSANIVGAMVSRGDFLRTGAGNIGIHYNSNLFGGKGPPKGLLVPVPGSWRDKATAY